MLVKDVMTSNVQSCTKESTLESVANLMWRNDCGAIPVVDAAGKPVGMVTDRDIAMGCSLNHRAIWDMTASEVANGRSLFCCSEDDDVETLLAQMREHQVRRIPVVDDNGRLCGIVATSDIINRAQKRASKSNGRISYDQVVDLMKAVSKPYHASTQVKAG